MIGKNCVLGPGSIAVMTNVPGGTVCDVRSVSIGDFHSGREEHSTPLCFASGSPIAPIAVWRKQREESESQSATRLTTTNDHRNIDGMTPKKKYTVNNGVHHDMTTATGILRKRNVN